MRILPGLRFRFSAGAIALLALAISSPRSGAQAGQFSVGVIEYNAKASQGGWSMTGKPPPFPLQIDLIANKVKDKSNASPVQFIALVQAGDGGTQGCVGNNGRPNDYLISCALNRRGLQGWNTIVSVCDYDQTQLAYSSEWKLVKALVNDYQKDVCWTAKDQGRPYNIAYFQNGNSKEMLLFVVVHMPHGYPDDCQSQSCPYGGKFAWNVPQFKADVQSVVGSGVDLKTVRLLIAGDMNDLGNDADPKRFVPIFDDFGPVKISKQAKTPPDPTCCADNGYSTFFDRIVTNDRFSEPSYEVVYLTRRNGLTTYYPLNKLDIIPNKKNPDKPRRNEEHKATYGVAIFN